MRITRKLPLVALLIFATVASASAVVAVFAPKLHAWFSAAPPPPPPTPTAVGVGSRQCAAAGVAGLDPGAWVVHADGACWNYNGTPDTPQRWTNCYAGKVGAHVCARAPPGPWRSAYHVIGAPPPPR